MARNTVEFWLTRDGKTDANYELWIDKPTWWEGRRYWANAEGIGVYCPEEWEELFPSKKLKPGQCRKVSITINWSR